jgi:heme exporter protein A
VLQARDLECERGGRKLFRGLSCGLLAPASGGVTWRGEPIAALREEFSRQLIYVGHAPAVKEDLTPAENLEITCRLAGLSVARAQILESLGRYSVPDDLVRKLSQGQRRRAALARLALSESAPLWLLDEPFSALDTHASGITEELISRHAGRGGMVVYTTHHEVGLQHTRRVDLDG